MQAVQIPCLLTNNWKIHTIVPQNDLLEQIRPNIFLYEGENADQRSNTKLLQVRVIAYETYCLISV
jgi:hypothetical protein